MKIEPPKNKLQEDLDKLERPFKREDCLKFIEQFTDGYDKHFHVRLTYAGTQKEIDWVMSNIQTAIDNKTLG